MITNPLPLYIYIYIYISHVQFNRYTSIYLYCLTDELIQNPPDPGGHGPMFDLATDATSQKIIADFASKGKVVAAVCHGPAVFVNVKLPDGTPLLKDREVTGFSNAEEDQVQLSAFMPFMLETELNKVSGGKYVKAAEPWGEKVVVAGNVITGQNPASAHAIGEAVVKALKA
jgi:putative intracellular protease/amidase